MKNKKGGTQGTDIPWYHPTSSDQLSAA